MMKEYCDRCEKEIPQDTGGVTVDIHPISCLGHAETGLHDLCGACRKLLDKFLEGGKVK